MYIHIPFFLLLFSLFTIGVYGIIVHIYLHSSQLWALILFFINSPIASTIPSASNDIMDTDNFNDTPSDMDTTEEQGEMSTAAAADIFNAALTVEDVMGTTTQIVAEQDATLQKRKAIRALMEDRTLSEQDRRLRIQRLMDGSNPTMILQQIHQEQLQQNQPEGQFSSFRNPHGGTEFSPSISNSLTSNTSSIPCVHYDRKCNIIAPCCNKVFGCRVCHDEFTNCEHGPMDRFQIKEIECKVCHTRQNSKTNICSNPSCQTTFAEYHCSICNLWMALSKKPFHCHECGFCRVGGEEKYKHCSKCSMCIHVDTYQTHHCLKDKFKNNCPVCHEDMFTSRHAPQDLPCGHAIHAHCFRKLAGFDYRCPICKKTVVSQKSMSRAWTERARDIESQPMPLDLQRNVDIMCYDCESKSTNLPWHFLGVQCPSCQSFNTVVENFV